MEKKGVLTVIFLFLILIGGVSADNIAKIEGQFENETKVSVIVMCGGRAVAVTSINFEMSHEYSTINGFSGKITKEGFEKLRNDSNVLSVHLDGMKHLFLMESVPLINADDAWAMQLNKTNITGKGETVCLVDSGIDTDHSAFSGRILTQYCYCSLLNPGDGLFCCPDNTAEDDSAEDDNGHGTHIAGIAAGNLPVKGVAPEAGIVAVKVCNLDGVCRDSDVIAGIDWCIRHASEFNISVISLSLGGEEQYISYCNGDSIAVVINSAVGKNISVMAATGNYGWTNGISSPACVESATPVGSTDDGSFGTIADEMSSFTNRGAVLNLLAPGRWITSSYNDGGTAVMGGTSMAAPHAAGAAILLKQFIRLQNGTDITPQRIEDIFYQTGMKIVDSGLIFSRIDVFAAINITFDNTPLICMDSDGDGFNQSQEGCGIVDCDDGNASIYSGSDENCNGVDDDCDELIDEVCDVTPPIIIISNPVNDSVINTDYVWLNATTNEESFCYYSLWNCSILDCAKTLPELMDSELIANISEWEGWRVGTSSKKLEMTENTDSWSGENFNDIISSIDEDELGILADSSITNEKGTAGYNQYINFEDCQFSNGPCGSGFVKFLENDEDISADYLYFKSGSQIARYALEFKTSFQSDVEDENGNNDPNGRYLGDYEGSKIKIIGKEYNIIKARRVNSAGNGVELTLVGDSIRDILKEGTSKNYNFNGKNYLIEVVIITNSAPITAKLKVNGELLRSLSEGQTAFLLDGTVIGVSEILLNNGDNQSDYVEFLLGKSIIYLKDTNIRDRISSNTLEYGSEKIDDTHIIITGSDDDYIFSIDTIELNITADDDYFVAAGHSLAEYMDEPQAFLESWDINYGGLDSSTEIETYKIKTSGSDTYKLEFVDGDGLQTTIPIFYTDGSNIRLGDNNDDLILKGSMKIQKNDYLIVSDYSKEDGKRTTYALRYKGANKVASGETALVKFDNLGAGKRIEQTFTESTGDTADATLKLGGASFGVINASADTSNDFLVMVDADADGIIQNDNDIVAINTNVGMKIVLDNETSNEYILATFSTPNEDDYDNVVPTPVKLKLGAFNGTVYFDEADDSTINWVTPSEEINYNYAYTSMGAKFKWENPSTDPDILTIEYPKEQRLPLVYITSKGQEIIEGQLHTALIEELENTESNWYEAHLNCTDYSGNSNEKSIVFNVNLIIVCTDNDSDGFNQSKEGCGIPDCDDSNTTIHPDAIELCNGFDDDCDGVLDGSENLVRQCGVSDISICTYGIETCNNNGNYINCNAVLPIQEVCGDDIDQDCDGSDLVCPNNYTIYSPFAQNYSDDRVPINLTLVRAVPYLKYIDYSDNRSSAKTLCRNCNESGFTRKKEINFDDGYHNVNIFSTDGLINETIPFFVDSTKPRVTGQEPMNKKYCNGEFYVKYTEEYIKTVCLYYGNDISTRDDCDGGRNQKCRFDVPLGEYENQTIKFHFEVEDLFWKIPYRMNYTCLVDTIPPNITFFDWWVDGRYLYLNISLDEKASIRYIDNNDMGPRERSLCSRCDEYGASRAKRKSFRTGEHDVTVIAEDDAGNREIIGNIAFTV